MPEQDKAQQIAQEAEAQAATCAQLLATTDIDTAKKIADNAIDRYKLNTPELRKEFTIACILLDEGYSMGAASANAADRSRSRK